MGNDEKFAAAAHLYVLLRRKSGRVVDTVWLLRNKDYALEILRLARQQSDDEIAKLADRLQVMMFGDQQASEDSPLTDPPRRYVHSLR